MECVSKYLASENNCKERDGGVLQYVTEVIEGCRGLYKTLDSFRKRIGKIPLPGKRWKNAALPGAFTHHRGIQSLRNRNSSFSDIEFQSWWPSKVCRAHREAAVPIARFPAHDTALPHSVQNTNSPSQPRKGCTPFQHSHLCPSNL